MYYIDTDFFLALVKENDWMKDRAVEFTKENEYFRSKELVTSSYTLLEVWFYFVRNGNFNRNIFHAIRSMVAEIKMLSTEDLETASLIKEQYKLNIGDSIHATFALQEEGIISSDDSFDDVPGLKRINFLAD